MSKRAFTLIELICVIAILSIMAAFILPKYNQTQQTAIARQEDAIVTALKEAMSHQKMLNVLNGTDESVAWPGQTGADNPFDHLSPKPPFKYGWALSDGKSWVTTWHATPALWYIYCPHWDGALDGAAGTRGTFYLYNYTNVYNATYGISGGQTKVFQQWAH